MVSAGVEPATEAWPDGNSVICHNQPLDSCLQTILDDRDQVFMTCSFGSESVLLLDAVYRVRRVPVVFVDTGFHFRETLEYVDELTERYDLDLVRVGPPAARPGVDTPEELNDCCYRNKVLPLRLTLAERFRGHTWISGVRREQTRERQSKSATERLEHLDIFKIYPLIDYTFSDVFAAIEARGLPRHPLVDKGYYSIGCEPCTQPSSPDQPRDGRWRDTCKKECGIHVRI